MNIVQLHAHLGRLLEAGIAPTLPATVLIDDRPYEIGDATMLSGKYMADPLPKMCGPVPRIGAMLTLVPVNSDTSDLLNDSASGYTQLAAPEFNS